MPLTLAEDTQPTAVIREYDPFAAYYESLEGQEAVPKIQIENLRSVFGFTGTMNADALKVNHATKIFNSRGIVSNRNPRRSATASLHRQPVEKLSIVQEFSNIQEKIEPILRHLDSTKETCEFCRKEFKLSENYGQWRCVYHFQPGMDLKKYECCGHLRGGPYDLGCTPCDHQATPISPYTPWSKITAVARMPLCAAVKLNIPSRAYKTVFSEKGMAFTTAIVQRTKEGFEDVQN